MRVLCKREHRNWLYTIDQSSVKWVFTLTRLWPREAGDEDTALANPQTSREGQRSFVGRGRQCSSLTCCSDTLTAQDAHCSDQLKKVKAKSVQEQQSLSSSGSTISRGSKATREQQPQPHLRDRDNDMCLTQPGSR